jgi:integrase
MPQQSSVSLAAFMHYGLTEMSWARSTLTKVVPSAVADMFRYSDASPASGQLVKDMKRTIMQLTTAPKSKLPITPRQLTLMVKMTCPTEQSVRNTFLMIIMFMGFLRESEAVALKFKDMWVERLHGKRVLFVFVEKAKNDQERVGHTIVLEEDSESTICPVKWFVLHCSVRRSETHVFHSLAETPLKLGPKAPNTIIKAMLNRIGIDPKPYGSHSLRRGGATSAASMGIEAYVIARHGNWRSNAVFTYMSEQMAQRLAVGRAIIPSK